MALSPTEDTIRFLGELIEACKAETLPAYVAEWLTEPSAQLAVAKSFEQAQAAMLAIAPLAEYIIEHYA